MATPSFLLLYKASVCYKVNPLASSLFKVHPLRNAESTQQAGRIPQVFKKNSVYLPREEGMVYDDGQEIFFFHIFIITEARGALKPKADE